VCFVGVRHLSPLRQMRTLPRKVDIRLPGKGNSNSHRARPVLLIITMIKWIQTSRLSLMNSLSRHLSFRKSSCCFARARARERERARQTDRERERERDRQTETDRQSEREREDLVLEAAGLLPKQLLLLLPGPVARRDFQPQVLLHLMDRKRGW